MVSAPLARIRFATALAGALLVGAFALGAAAPERAGARAAIGVYLPNAHWDPGEIDRYAAAAGRYPAIVHVYGDFSAQPFNPRMLEEIAVRGAVPMLTWEPWTSYSTGVPLGQIAKGTYDAYLADAARNVAAWGKPIFVRFAHEMNGGWYPWGKSNKPKVYRAAWRRIVKIFRGNGARNVRWVWTPYLDGGSRPFERYYPGDRWVDWAGLDGFNWGTRFLSFSKIFGKSYREMVKLTRKPLMIAEVGSVEYGGNKPRWIRQALGRQLRKLKRVRALVWWSGIHKDKGTDVRLDSSLESFAAWAGAIQARRLKPGRKFLLSKPPWLKKKKNNKKKKGR